MGVLGAYAVRGFQPAIWRGGSIDHIPAGTANGTGSAILVGSSHTESRFLPIPVSAEQKRWLLAPLLACPVPGPVEYLPIEFGPVNEPEVRKVRRCPSGDRRRKHVMVWR
jgi:hypothetical protein